MFPGQACCRFTKAIKINPKSALPFNDRSITPCKKGELKKAPADFSRAIVLDPKPGKADNNRGVTF